MSATDTVLAYYDALRAGEPLPPFFAERDDLVKVGITERLEGYEAVAAGLREQTAATSDWTVESAALRVVERGDAAWFSDRVTAAWTEDGERREYDSRWSGTLVRSTADEAPLTRGGGESGRPARTADDENGGPSGADDDGEWRFVGMHVSAPH